MARLSVLITGLLARSESLCLSPGRLATEGNVQRYTAPLGGRGHAGIETPEETTSVDAVGAWLANATHAEAASVIAFKAVARELEVHGAPKRLPIEARKAARDEVRHAQLMEAMATRWGVQPRRPSVASIEVRTLEAMAIENAAQGCVRETWAAMEASYQARRARDPVIRRAMMEISRDELRHAEFSWAVDRWARTRVGERARVRIKSARRHAAQALLVGMQGRRDRALCIEAGMPNAPTARRLAEELSQVLWA